MEDLKQNWDLILQTFKERYELQDISFNSWIKPIEVYTVENDTITLIMSSTSMNPDMAVSYVEKKYLEMLRITICEIMNHEYDVRLITAKDKQAAEIKKAATGSAAKNSGLQNLNPNYTFDTFVVGTNNNLAHAASLAVAETPGQVYNPLFIYGPSGVGKTHLLYAIANEIHKHHPDYNIVYIKGDQFTNELINSLREGKNNEFRLKYRGADLFLVDDIQFIAGKDSTQEEFFHTFNNLYESHKQIVLTSDRPPNEMVRLEDRLRTRFEWGLLADIQPPDYETRMAIIKNKAVNLGFDLPDDVCNYIAENITNNVRQIEGTVKKIKAFKELNGMVLDVPNVARAIKDMFKGKTENLPTPSLIVSEVCQYYGIEEQVLRSTLKNKNTAEARQVAMYLIRTMTNLSLPEIGREFDRDHTTVMHGLKKVEQTLQNSASPLNDTIRDITANVNNKL